MDGKLKDITDAFQHYRFEDCIRLIDQMLKKNQKQDKKKATQLLNESEMRMINILRIGSTLGMGRFHQANKTYEDQNVSGKEAIEKYAKESPFLFMTMSELFLEGKENDALQIISKGIKQQQTVQIQRFYLNCNQFSALGRIFLKQFVAKKNNQIQLAQIYLEYLQCLNKEKMIVFERDGLIHQNEALNLKLVNMFMTKFRNQLPEKNSDPIKEIETQKQKEVRKMKQRTYNQTKLLSLKLAIHQKKSQNAIKIFKECTFQVNQSFVYLRSILKSSQQPKERQINKRFYIEEMSRIFRKNLILKDYTPLYDYYDEFLTFILKQIQIQNGKELFSQIKYQPILLQNQHLYVFQENLTNVQLLIKYISSLTCNYSALTKMSQQNSKQTKKSDYYKISLKSLLLQLIRVSSILESEKKSKLHFLKEYHNLFSQTLTYPSELNSFWKQLIEQEILRRNQNAKTDGQIIRQINFTKISLGLKQKDFSSFQKAIQILDELESKYKAFYTQQTKSKLKLQKGERYLSDQFLLILVDFARAFIEANLVSQRQIQSISFKIFSILLPVIKSSPFNADLKLRFMHVCSLLNYHEDIGECFLTLDIKSIQMETLGYWIVRPSIQFNLADKYETIITNAVRSYQSNARETSEYSLKSLKGLSFDQTIEFLCFRKNISLSYPKTILLYLLYFKHKLQQNSQYFLLQIKKDIERMTIHKEKLSFNSDFKIMENQVYPECQFADFYGVYNNYKTLYNEVSIRLAERWLIAKITNKPTKINIKNLIQIEQFKASAANLKVQDIFDFKEYKFQDNQLNVTAKQLKNTIKHGQKYLQNYQKLLNIKCESLNLAESLFKFYSNIERVTVQVLQKQSQLYLKAVGEHSNFFNSLNWRDQTRLIFGVRSYLLESLSLLTLIQEQIPKNKKLKQFKETVFKFSERCFDQTYQTLIDFKFAHRLEIEKRFLTESIEQRDGNIEKLNTFDAKQIKKALSKHTSAYLSW